MDGDRDAGAPLRYDGFASPTFTSVPDDVFDLLMPRLSGAELRALLYIIRRTFGFKRDRDPISLGQFLRGIVTRDGRRLDAGCGVRDRTTLSAALRSLEAKGVIVSEKATDERGDAATTVYRLRFRDAAPEAKPTDVGKPDRGGRERLPGVVGEPDHGDGESLPPVVGKPDPQLTGSQHTGSQEYSNLRKAPVYGQDADGHAVAASAPSRTGRRGAVVALMEALDGERRRLAARPGGSPSRAPGHSVDAAGASITAAGSRPEPEPVGPADARRARRRRPGEGDEDRRVILAYIEDVARELGDQAALASSTSRACNLYRRAGIDRAAFIEALLEARTVTKARGASIRALASKGGWLVPTPKMAYFFAVLEDALGLRDDSSASKA